MKTVMLTINTLIYTIWSLLYFCQMVNTFRSHYLEPDILRDDTHGDNTWPTVRETGHANTREDYNVHLTESRRMS